MDIEKNKQPMKMLKPFGPSVLKLIIPDKTLVSLNKYVDEIINDEVKMKKLDHGSDLAGNVNQEFFLETEFIKSVISAAF